MRVHLRLKGVAFEKRGSQRGHRGDRKELERPRNKLEGRTRSTISLNNISHCSAGGEGVIVISVVAKQRNNAALCNARAPSMSLSRAIRARFTQRGCCSECWTDRWIDLDFRPFSGISSVPPDLLLTLRCASKITISRQAASASLVWTRFLFALLFLFIEIR